MEGQLRQETVNLLQKINCASTMPYKREKRVRLTETGWRVFVLMEAMHMVLELNNKELIRLNKYNEVDNNA